MTDDLGALFLAVRMGQPILFGGEPGVGKTTQPGSRMLGQQKLAVPVASQTLSTVLKYPEDQETVRQAGLAQVVTAID